MTESDKKRENIRELFKKTMNLGLKLLDSEISIGMAIHQIITILNYLSLDMIETAIKKVDRIEDELRLGPGGDENGI